jgi:osmotically-inducible protein OsmY
MVDTEQQRAAAEEAVLAVPGVTDVENRVSVGKSSSGSRFDLG